MSKSITVLSVLSVVSFLSLPVSAETIVLNAVPGNSPMTNSWKEGGATYGDDASAPGGTASTYTGKHQNRQLFVPLKDTALGTDDAIALVQVRVYAKANVNMSGTYDGLRISLCQGYSVSRSSAIHELDTAYKYYSDIWAKNPVTGVSWTWAAICSLQAGVLTAKTKQGTNATYSVDHIQVVVTYGHGNSPPAASSVAISGIPAVGQTLTGSYVYYDNNNDPEGASLFQWYRMESANPNDSLKAAISDGTEKTLVLSSALAGKYLLFEVTPVAAQGVTMGIPAASAIIGPVTGSTTAGAVLPVFTGRKTGAVMYFTITGRTVMATRTAELSKGAYVKVVKTANGVRCENVAVVK